MNLIRCQSSLRAPSMVARCKSTAPRSRLTPSVAPAFLSTPPKGPAASGNFEFIRSGAALPPPSKPVAVQSRYGLPGAARPATNALLPAQLAPATASFPVVITASVDAASTDSAWKWAAALRTHLDELLPKHGVVVVHGLEDCVGDVDGFSRFMAALKADFACDKFMEGRSMTSTQMTDLVRTGSDDHPASNTTPATATHSLSCVSALSLTLRAPRRLTRSSRTMSTWSQRSTARVSFSSCARRNRPTGASGRSPTAPSCWKPSRATFWPPLKPAAVCVMRCVRAYAVSQPFPCSSFAASPLHAYSPVHLLSISCPSPPHSIPTGFPLPPAGLVSEPGRGRVQLLAREHWPDA